ncbi:class I SAM-dependent methyltransferase [Natrononativus amylolyticus]|uniref:class I SAM-dependent methyltransferase n=1 Tax=Natrononativus amylolyticus TaxID=2963434 RepID=UPI0020CB8279|nr:class I SAM-dependent methyltransferase [Natrononativus amylolyticus]
MYDSEAETYEDRYQGFEGRYLTELETNYIIELIDTTTGSVLDIGTGGGRFVRVLNRTGQYSQLVGLDVSAEMLKQSKTRSPHDFVRGDASQLPFTSNTFDLVTAIGIFEYIEDLVPLLRDINRVLAPQGQLVFTVHNQHRLFPRLGEWAPQQYDVALHSLPDVRFQLMVAGFTDTEITSTFYFNEYVWAGIPILETISQRLSRVYLETTISVQHCLASLPWTRHSGGQFIVSAKVPVTQSFE